MMTTQQLPTVDSDEQLVEWSLTGDRDAFAQIVERYKSLVCSITYGATGSLAWSEDLAQEAFVTAWKQLPGLREPSKLRSWLCAITRNLLGKELRRRGHEPMDAAEPLDAVQDSVSPGPLPSTEAISREEEAILWRALQRIPETYREPMILFYREEESVERVAAELDLSEDAVKQRLSRGRKLLADEVAGFIETTLRRTTPGKAFTLGVLAVLPAMAMSAKAAAVGTTAAKSSTSAAGLAGLFGALAALFAVGSYTEYRLCLAELKTDDERRRLRSFYRNIGAFVLGIFVAFAGAVFWLYGKQLQPAVMISFFISELFVIFVLTRFVFAATRIRWQRAYYSHVLAQEYAGRFPAPAWEFRSRWTLLGLPLVHIRIGDRFDVIKKPVTAWIAVGGKYAVGALLAFGEFAIAPVSIGWCAVGLVPFGGVALAPFAIGAFSVGVWSIGGLALGWEAYGACAIGWKAAMGWIALAREFALGVIGHGSAGVQAAQTFFQSSLFFRFAQALMKYFAWLNLLWVVPCWIQLRIVARAKARRTS
ncbi:MAG TPA: sigma-70 family RNA polymerase sigma factor [Verrucomicrobiae bacterium]|nr:sigma-70 family RNA polymerase sigma factor [Verrucomicrobiae bacterium]